MTIPNTTSLDPGSCVFGILNLSFYHFDNWKLIEQYVWFRSVQWYAFRHAASFYNVLRNKNNFLANKIFETYKTHYWNWKRALFSGIMFFSLFETFWNMILCFVRLLKSHMKYHCLTAPSHAVASDQIPADHCDWAERQLISVAAWPGCSCASTRSRWWLIQSICR